MKKTIRILLRIIITPALFIHELCHVLASLIVGLSPKNFGWSFFILRGPINAMVYFDGTLPVKLRGLFADLLLILPHYLPLHTLAIWQLILNFSNIF